MSRRRRRSVVSAALRHQALLRIGALARRDARRARRVRRARRPRAVGPRVLRRARELAAAAGRSAGVKIACDVTGLVLAGGKGRRMGGVDKGLVLLDGRRWSRTCIERLAPQVGALVDQRQPERRALRRVRLSGRRRRGRRLRGPARRTARGDDRGDHAVRRHRAVRFAVPAARPRRAARGATRRAKRAARGRAYVRAAASGVRAGRPRRAAAPRQRSSKAAGARSTRGTRRLRVVAVHVRRRGRAFRNINTAGDELRPRPPETVTAPRGPRARARQQLPARSAVRRGVRRALPQLRADRPLDPRAAVARLRRS